MTRINPLNFFEPPWPTPLQQLRNQLNSACREYQWHKEMANTCRQKKDWRRWNWHMKFCKGFKHARRVNALNLHAYLYWKGLTKVPVPEK